MEISITERACFHISLVCLFSELSTVWIKIATRIHIEPLTHFCVNKTSIFRKLLFGEGACSFVEKQSHLIDFIVSYLVASGSVALRTHCCEKIEGEFFTHSSLQFTVACDCYCSRIVRQFLLDLY